MSGQDRGLDLSTREIAGLLRRARAGELSGEEIDGLWNRVPRASKVEFLAYFFDEKVVPHIEDVNERAASDDAERYREVYADQDEETKDELFLEAVHDIITTLFEIRENPKQGLLNLKELIRDPATAEAVLLVFDDAEHIDPAYSREAKEFAAWYLTAAGVAVAPELYDEGTVREVYDAFGLNAPEDT